MVRRADDAEPNLALYNLRESAGQSQHDLADALNGLAARHGRKVALTANQLSRWECGKSRPIPFYRRLLAEHFGVTVEQLGLAQLRDHDGPAAAVVDVTLVDQFTAPVIAVDPKVESSQDSWRAVRHALNQRRVPLAHAVAGLYDQAAQLGATGLLVGDGWIPTEPIRLPAIKLEYDDGPAPAAVTGTDPCTDPVRPMSGPGRRYQRYSQAIRGLDHPRLFENRHAWRLLELNLDAGNERMAFGDTTYFEQIDLAESLAHETAQRLLDSTGKVMPPSWRGLTTRRAIGDPFDLSRRALAVSVNTITIRRDRDGASFVLHQRNAGNVAVAGGMFHVMPCGVFQPSSIQPAAQRADFSLWRNMQREYSEEFLGNPEHDGSGFPVDYDVPPFSSMQRGLDNGRMSVHCLGVGLDALTLFGEILTVAVFDADLYDDLFAGMVDVNEEGSIVKTGRIHPTSAIPFTEHTIGELLDSGRMAPAGAGCLTLAWQHRRTLLDG